MMTGARARRLIATFGPFVGLALVVALFAVLDHVVNPPGYRRFLAGGNLQNVAVQTVIVSVAALGMTFVIISGGIDLAVGSIMALCSVVTAKGLAAGLPVPVAAVLGVAAGAACGATSGLLITRLRLVPFVVTLGMLGIARGLAKWLTNQRAVNADGGWLESMMYAEPSPTWLLVAPSVWLAVVLAVICGVVLRRTRFGTHVYAIGSNEATARLCGVRVERTRVLVYMTGGVFAGLAGVLLFGELTQGDPTAAIGTELAVIAAVVIGGGSLAGGEGRVVGTVVGALIMAFLANGCTLIGAEQYVQEILIGAVIIAAVALDRLRRGRE